MKKTKRAKRPARKPRPVAKMLLRPVPAPTAPVGKNGSLHRQKRIAERRAKRLAKAATKAWVAKPGRVPEDLKPFVVKKFKTKKTATAPSKLVLVVKTNEGVTAVASVVPGEAPSILREFKVPERTELPENVWRATSIELAIWWARSVARNPVWPSARKERSRRKSVWKKAVARYKAHLQTKTVLEHHGVVAKPKPAVKEPVVPNTFICIYNPRAHRFHKATFQLHEARCVALDGARRKAHRANGASWVIEAAGAESAIRMQMAEFEDDDKGYDRSDFSVHECGQEDPW